MTNRKPEVLLDGLAFGEGPRWHEDRLWFSDMHEHRVMTVDMGGNAAVVCEVPTQPSGLGWTPEGLLLIVSMVDRKLLRLDPGRLTEVADMSALATFHCNDMVVDAKGRAYVGHFGFDIFTSQERVPASLILVEPDGSVHEVADELRFPNGTVITPDGETLIVGETAGARLTAFDIAEDGSLSNRRLWAPTEGAVPDGICLDAEGGIWVASPRSAEVIRVLEGGEITERIPVETQAFACMLGGPERKHLLICTAGSSVPDECRANLDGRIEVVEVDVPGAGLP